MAESSNQPEIMWTLSYLLSPLQEQKLKILFTLRIFLFTGAPVAVQDASQLGTRPLFR